jgi:glycosyl hydrolase family 47
VFKGRYVRYCYAMRFSVAIKRQPGEGRGGHRYAASSLPCRTDAGYTVLKSVVTKEKGNIMHSFFLAETLKYLYPLFSPDEALDLQRVVFNTEAHPLRRTW